MHNWQLHFSKLNGKLIIDFHYDILKNVLCPCKVKAYFVNK